MTVQELIEILKDFPQDMQILNKRCSDYELIDIKDFSVVMGVENDGWVMKSHPTMSEENKRHEKSYLLLDGN